MPSLPPVPSSDLPPLPSSVPPSLPVTDPACLICRDTLREDPDHIAGAAHKAEVQRLLEAQFADDTEKRLQVFCEASVLRAMIREELRLGLCELQEQLPIKATNRSRVSTNSYTGALPRKSDKNPALPPIGEADASAPVLGPRDAGCASHKAADFLHLPGANEPVRNFHSEDSERRQVDPETSGVAEEPAPELCTALQEHVGSMEGGSPERSSETASLVVTEASKSAPISSNGIRQQSQQSLDRSITTKTKGDGPVSKMSSFFGKKPPKSRRRSLMSAHTDYELEMTRVQRLTGSKFYELVSGTLILVNAVFIGWHTQYVAERYRDLADTYQQFDHAPIIFLVMHIIFAMLFTVDLLLRWISDGLFDFFRSNDLWWNLLDVLVVFVGNTEAVLDIVERTTSSRSGGVLQNISIVRVLRVVRVVRVVRVIRVMRFFRELRMMVYSILGSMKNLMWVMVILGVTFYLFGITFTSGVTHRLLTPEDWRNPKNAEILRYFGTVDRSVLSLFMSMSGGIDWIALYDVLQDFAIGYRMCFLLFVSFTLFAIVNIVTGVFVEAALQSNLKDLDIIAHEELQSKKKYLESMQDLFEEMDDDSEGTISMDEFESKLQDERVIAYFHALKLDVSDACMLFHLLDIDESGEITIDEFLEGCYRLQGESRMMDMKIMQFEVKHLSEKSSELSEMLREVRQHMMPDAPVKELKPKYIKASSGVSKLSQNGMNEAKRKTWQQALGFDVAGQSLDMGLRRQAVPGFPVVHPG